MKGRSLSPSRVARIATLLAYSFFVSWLAQGGRLASVAHPRMHLWIELSGLVCLGLAFFQLFRIYRSSGRGDPPSYFVPIAFVIAMTFVYVDSGSFAPGRFSSGDDSLAAADAAIARMDGAAKAASAGPLPETIVLDDDRYWTLYNRLYDAPAEAAGRRIVVRGFFGEAKGAPPGVGLVGRNLMWCCSADMAEIGFLVRGGDFSGFGRSDWVEARGRLGVIDCDLDGDGKASAVPVVELESIRRVDKGSTSAIIFPY